MSKTVYVSFTSLPSRLSYVQHVVENILEHQTYKNIQLTLYIPRSVKRTGQTYILNEDIMRLLIKYKNFHIKFCEVDYGPATKIIPSLLEHTQDDDILICVDDDILLEKHAIEELVDSYNAFDDSLLGFMGTWKNQHLFLHSELIYCNTKVDLLGGYRSILFPRHLIKEQFFREYDELMKLHEPHNIPVLDDDMFYHNFCHKHKIPMHVIKTKYTGNLNSDNILEKINIKFLESSKLDAINGGGEMTSISNKIIESYYS